MKTIIGPRGLGVLSFLFLTGCGGGGDNKKQPEAEPIDAQVSVTISSRHTITNVRKLVLRMVPLYLNQSDGSSIRLLSDDAGQNLMSNGGNPDRDVIIIDTLQSSPLPGVTVVRSAALSRDYLGDQSDIVVQAWGGTSGTASYVELDDGRHCVINVILPGDNDARTTGDNYATFSLRDVRISGGERWRIDLTLDPSMASFNPATCANTTDFRLYPDGATAERM